MIVLGSTMLFGLVLAAVGTVRITTSISHAPCADMVRLTVRIESVSASIARSPCDKPQHRGER